MVASGVTLVWVGLSASSPSEESRVDAAALSYARGNTVWTKGPAVRATRIVRLKDLNAALAATTPGSVRPHIAVSDLIRQYGPEREVGLVVLTGTYYTLPPDEGVNLNGNVVVLVDVKTNKVLLLAA